MAVKLLFDPQAITKLLSPFQFLINENKKIEYFDFYSKNIKEIFGDVKCKLSIETIEKERNTIIENHKKMGLKTDLQFYLTKYIKLYYHPSFFEALHLFKLNFKPIVHRVEIAPKKFKINDCKIFDDCDYHLSFEIIKQKSKIKIKTWFHFEGKKINLKDLKRYYFLVQFDDHYYSISKKDADLLDEIEQTDWLDYPTFNEKWYKRLSFYSLDSSDLFDEEVREIEPKTIIQISELSSKFLMFIPIWEYDGHGVDNQNDSFEIFQGNKKITYKRNKKAEEETFDFLRAAHPSFAGKNSFYLDFKEASKKNWFFHFYHDQLKDNYHIVGMDMLGYFRYSEHVLETELKIIKTVDNEIVAKFINKFGNEKIDLKNLQKSIFENNKFILLKNNTLGILTDEWYSRFGMILRYATIEKETITFAKWLLIVSDSLVEYEKNLKFLLPDNWLQKWDNWNKNTDSIYPISKNIHAELRNYQHKGYEWLNLMSEVNAGTLLADDMGLGKTLQTISTIAHWIDNQSNAKVLIVCPASLIYNWKKEFEKFAPSYKIQVYHGSDRDFNQFIKEDCNIIITSYSIVRNDQDDFVKLVWDAVILDESHNIKNLQTKQTQAVLRLMAKRRIILNGTPIMNSVADLFPQLHFLLPQLFHSHKRFKEDFENPIQKSISEVHTEMLRKLTNPFILRRTKEVAAPDLPPKTESVMWCEMNADQREAYETLKKQVKQNVFSGIDKNGLNKSKFDVLQGITKLRQMCSSPKLVKEMDEFHHASSIKIESLLETLTTNLKDNKVIIFSQYLETMSILAENFEKNNIQYLRFDGSTPPEKRIELVTEFQNENSETQVFLLSLMAGNSGINLTQANYVFLVEPWWNKPVQQQAIDRVHRIGQNQHVFAYNMICKDSIEEKIIELQNRKQSISNEIIGNDEGFVKNLSREDIAFLFE